MSVTSVPNAALAWIVGADTGTSSKTIWAHMMGQRCSGSYPSDGGDFGRCVRLLEAVPEWQPRLSEMASVNKYWAALVKHWDELVKLYAAGKQRDLYYRMKAILGRIEDADPNIVKISENAKIHFGRGDL